MPRVGAGSVELDREGCPEFISVRLDQAYELLGLAQSFFRSARHAHE
jgi:hypothetical protein